jgi:hypothetical protein
VHGSVQADVPIGADGNGRPALERFLDRIQVVESGCWLWTGAKVTNGYGKLRVDGKQVLAHRWSYAHYVGAVPDGLDLDHLCRASPLCESGSP